MKRKQVVNPALPGRYSKMDAAELNREAEEFDREFIADTAESLSRKERARERRARRGRPKVGQGAARVLITIEKDLLQRSDKYAKRVSLSRSALVARGLKAILAHQC